MNTFLVVLASFSVLIFCMVRSFLMFFVPNWLRKKKCIKGSRVLITGAGSGMGREIAIEFSKHSVCLILVDINRPSLLQTEKLLDRKSTVFIYDCDVSDYGKVCEMSKNVQREAGDVDILVNNAGIMAGKYLLDLEEGDIVKTMGVNTLAHFWTCKAFLPAMMAKNKGHIVNMVSMACRFGAPRLTDYCASKFAAAGFAQTLYLELQQKKLDGIKVTTVNPAHVSTEMFAGLKWKFVKSLTPQYVAQKVVTGVLLEEETIFLPHFTKLLAMLLDPAPLWVKVLIMKMTDFSEAFSKDLKRPIQDEDNTRDKSKKLE